MFKKPTENTTADSNNIDSILDLIRDKGFTIALPLPIHIETTETKNFNSKIETLNNLAGSDRESSNYPTPRFPFLSWQDNSSILNVPGFIDDNLRNTNIDSQFQDSFNTLLSPSNGTASNVEAKSKTELQPTNFGTESFKKTESEPLKTESRFSQQNGNLDGVSDKARESGTLHKNAKEARSFSVPTSALQQSINKEDESPDMLESKSSESEKQEDISQYEDALKRPDKTLADISPRKLEAGSSDEPIFIFQGRIDSDDQKKINQSMIEQSTDEQVAGKEGDGICDHIETESERVRCKVIACFGDNETCYE